VAYCAGAERATDGQLAEQRAAIARVFIDRAQRLAVSGARGGTGRVRPARLRRRHRLRPAARRRLSAAVGATRSLRLSQLDYQQTSGSLIVHGRRVITVCIGRPSPSLNTRLTFLLTYCHLCVCVWIRWIKIRNLNGCFNERVYSSRMTERLKTKGKK